MRAAKQGAVEGGAPGREPSRVPPSGPVFLVPKTSLYERFAGAQQADPKFRRALDEESPLVQHVWRSHQANRDAVTRMAGILEDLGLPVELRRRASRKEAARARLIVTVGGDGTLLDAAHWVGDRPVFGVNSNPERSVGTFCTATVADAREKLERVLDGEVDPIPVARMAIWVNGRRLPHQALNDVLFAHRCPAAISDYVLRVAGEEEWQRSSGVWFSTPAGSTGAIRAAGGVIVPVRARTLQYLVREPFRADGKSYRLVKGFAESGVELVSRVFDGAVFIDGHRLQRRMGFGDVLRLEVSPDPLRLYLF